MNVYAILYTYSGYDGEIDRLWQNNNESYLLFSSKELADQYFKKHNLNPEEFEIKEISIIETLDK